MFCTILRYGQWLLLWWPLMLAAAPATQFDQLILALQTAPPEWRIAFAELALGQLADAYFAEAELARTPPASAPAATESARWSHGVESYAHQLLRLQQAVAQAADVTILQPQGGDAIITLPGTRMMLSHPRPDQQRVFEQALVERFCQWHGCGFEVNTADALMESAPVYEVRPDWLFAVEGTACRHQGLHLWFPRASDITAMRQFCTGLFAELEQLVAELAKLQQFGLEIQWQQLTLIPNTQTLQLNRRGDILMLELPTLRRYPRLLPQLQPWLAERAQGRSATLKLSATELGWP